MWVLQAQGRVKLNLNVDVSMRCTMSFYFVGVMLLYCVLQLGKKKSSSRDFDVQKYLLFYCGWHFDCKYLSLVILLSWIYVR